ncbi:uncharacterized protein LOC144700001 [Wolffia australiana]
MPERNFALTSELFRRFGRTKKIDGSCSSVFPSSYTPPQLLFCIVLALAFVSSCWITIAMMRRNTEETAKAETITRSPPWPPLICSEGHLCRATPPSFPFKIQKPLSTCPFYYRWIHEDLRPWRATGITKEMVERARRTASFRLVIISGRIYIERYRKSFQSRDVFTIWGILQLLRRYPDRVPDLDLMFDCVDWPVIRKTAAAPPPLFRYCGDDSTLDIVFPDWSFWGWPEINIRPWETLLEEILEGNAKTKWADREPYAYWKGNPYVAETRQDLLRCNVSAAHDWKARIYAQDWRGETLRGFKGSNLARQCLHRYKIYIEGSAWSVSEKYILACDSLTLLVKPRYYDFFSRGLFPGQHYWPVRDDDKCRSIEFAVRWGNAHQQKAQEMGKEGSKFAAEQLKMERVYDYMLHLLTEYAKLLRFQPSKPGGAEEYCPERMICNSTGVEKAFMAESLVEAPSAAEPCLLPPPFSPAELERLAARKPMPANPGARRGKTHRG